MKTLDVINPSTGQLLNSYPLMSSSTVEDILTRMDQAQKKHAALSLADRRQKMKKLAQIFRDRRQTFATMITQEMGKPITQALGEIDKCAWLADFYAETTAQYLAPEMIQTDYSKSYVCYEPLGIIFAVMPWNFPFWQVMRFAVPNLMVGNAALLKHAPNSTGAALLMESAFREAGFEEHLFRSLIIDVDLASLCINHPKVKGITLTGSGRAGQAVGAQAGKALKKVVLELGGSDPYLILKDADLDLAAQECATSRMSNAGQVCISAKRIIVVDAVREAFLKKFLAKISEYRPGDPMDPQTKLGPMARSDLRDQLHDQVTRSIQAGAQLHSGGKKLEGPGFFYEPTVFLDVKKGTPAYDEELFGPVACVIYAKDTEEAIQIANDSPYGLGAAVFTQDLALGEDIARNRLNAGTCNVNTRVSSDPRLPFGGIKQSGYGRELGAYGIREFMNVKTVVLK
jgi:succinate-semialdehyde dehydrogenase / glutarate-semialdehyde dehydrogenase